MSNPGPAVTTSIHPSNLGTNQALRVIAVKKGLSLGTLGDTVVPVINTQLFVPTSVVVANANNAGANVDVSSVNLGVYTAASQGNSSTSILTAAALTSQTTTTYVTVSAASHLAYAQSAQNLYFNVSSATATATVDVYVYGYDLSATQ